jgi:hypothetical protein
MYFAQALGAADVQLRPDVVEAATKWAQVRGLPLQWVLATILVESRGNPLIVGDRFIIPEGASIGLMQINTVAWKDRLRRAKVTRQMLFNVDKNVEWGTLIMREKYDKVMEALVKTRRPLRNPVPVDVLMRLLYTGVDVLKAIYNGVDPRADSNPKRHAARLRSVSAWNQAQAATSALV